MKRRFMVLGIIAAGILLVCVLAWTSMAVTDYTRLCNGEKAVFAIEYKPMDATEYDGLFYFISAYYGDDGEIRYLFYTTFTRDLQKAWRDLTSTQ